MVGELIEEGLPITLNAGDQPLAESSDQKVSRLIGAVQSTYPSGSGCEKLRIHGMKGGTDGWTGVDRPRNPPHVGEPFV
jgi:hypothetical protein